MDKPTVRLESGKSKKNKATPPAEQNVKLAIRLNEVVNEALRGLIRYRGDLSRMVIEALTTVELDSAPLVSADEKMAADTTITLPMALHKKVKQAAESRRSSMNIIVTTALAHWLKRKGVVNIR